METGRMHDGDFLKTSLYNNLLNSIILRLILLHGFSTISNLNLIKGKFKFACHNSITKMTNYENAVFTWNCLDHFSFEQFIHDQVFVAEKGDPEIKH